MAGILANSASKTMVAGDTAVDKSVSGYVLNEQIVLTLTPTPASQSWAMSIPSAADSERSHLSSTTAAGPTFTPTAAGTYLVTCTVPGGVVYNIRIAAVAVAAAETLQVMRFLPLVRSSVPTPSQGVNVFCDSVTGDMAKRKTDGLYYELDDTPIP